MNYTSEQQTAIERTGKVIVSASAGSGKTAVMIEKIIRLILSGVPVSDILAVTFTKKAASQMKDKLKRKLIETVNDPETDGKKRQFLKEQLNEVATADISTIHAFCSKFIKTRFFEADVSSDFKIISGDDAESAVLKNKALDKIFEDGYEADEDGDFFKLLSVYYRKKSDSNLKEIILNLYSGLRDDANYRALLSRSGNYDERAFDKVCDGLFTLLKRKCFYYASMAEDFQAYFEANDGEPSAKQANEFAQAFLEIANAPDYFTAIKTQKATFSRKESTKKRPKEYAEKVEKMLLLRDKKYANLFKEFAKIGSYEEERTAFYQSGEYARALAKYLLKFDEEYTRVKRERNALDYNDLEHIALSLLSNERIQKETRERYKYVFVDEYQDVNPVQEKLIELLGGENVFLVGDVKQAIYGFRGSKSKYFGEKQAKYSATGGSSLQLTKNFRSSDTVLDAINEQFCSIMTKETSSVSYACDSVMQKGGGYPAGSGKVVAHVLDTAESLEEEKLLAQEEKNAPLSLYSVRETYEKGKGVQTDLKTAKKIKEIIDEEVGSTFFDVELQKERTVLYSDIVILTRKTTGGIRDIAVELSDLGVPVTSVSAVNICDYAEVKTLIDILKLLDNERQDAPLCSALLSAMGGLTVNELAEIRLAYPKEKYFRNACKLYEREQTGRLTGKLRRFYAFYQRLRTLATVAPAGEVLGELLSSTRMEAEILSRENGNACLNRVRRFVAESASSEPLTLHEFLSRLKNLDYKIPYAEGGGENSVQIVTMHSSKGLEYPVVIVNATEKFRRTDSGEVVIEEEFGLATKAYDGEKMIQRTTLLRKLFSDRKSTEEIGDELNLYYVAMTRAKHTLHLVYQSVPELCDVAYANSFAELTDFSVWEKYLRFGVEEPIQKQTREAEGGTFDEELTGKIQSAFSFSYPFSGAENLPVKSSATSILKAEKSGDEAVYALFDDAENERKEAEETDLTEEIPPFKTGKTERAKTGVARGLAYHAFLEKFDFSLLFEGAGTRCSRKETVEKALEKFREEGKLSLEELSLLETEKLVEILEIPVFKSLEGYTLYKEQQFLVGLPLKDAPSLLQGVENSENILDEEILFQGAIDLLAVATDGSARIIDYKYSVKDGDALKASYAPQLDLYKKAVARILKTDLSKIRCSIVNLYKGFSVDLEE